MARVAHIPQIVAEQGLDTQRSTQPNIQVDMSPYKAMQDLGDTLAHAGFSLAAHAKAKDDQMQEYKTERGFQEFQNNTLLDKLNYDQEADPSGQGYLKGYQERYSKLQSDFETTVPENLKPQYAVKLENFKGQVTLNAAQDEVTRRNTYYDTTLDHDADGLAATVRAHPESSDAAWAQINTNVELSGLNSVEKAKKLDIYKKKLDASTVEGFTDQGEFEKARDYIQHLGPAPSVVPQGSQTQTDVKDKSIIAYSRKPQVVVYSHVDYQDVQPRVKAAINSVSSELGIQLNVTSGYRGLTHPAEARKAAGAFHRHTTGEAVDIDAKGYDNATRAKIITALVARGATGLGTYPNSPDMIHVDWTGFGAGVKREGISTWYGGQSSDKAPQWFKDAYHKGLALRKTGAVKYDTRTTIDSNVQPVEPGNIDLYNRPVVKNKDGTVSTVKSVSYNIDGKEVLLPTVTDDGRVIDTSTEKGKAEVIRTYLKTGKHLGKFNTPAEADAYAQQLHVQQEKQYVDVVPNKLTAENWTLKNFQPWEFGTDVNVDAPVAAAFDLMTGTLGRKYSFKAKDSKIKLSMDGVSADERQNVVHAALSSGFNGLKAVTENGKTYLEMSMDGKIVKPPDGQDVPKPDKNYTEIAGANAHFVPMGSPDAGKLSDYIDKAEEDANVQKEKATKAAQNEVSKDGWTLVRDGTLDDKWLDENKDRLAETDYRMLSKQLMADKAAKAKGTENKPYTHDMAPFVELMRRAVDPKDPEVLRDAVDAQSKNLIDTAHFNKIYDTYQKTVTNGAFGKPSDWKPIVRKYLTDKILKNPDDPEDTKYMDDRINALFELDDFMKEHPEATRDVVRKQADDILKKYNGAANEDKRAGLTMDALPGVGRYDKITPVMIKTAAQKVEADFKAGVISKDIRGQRLKELTDWYTVISNEAKSGR